MSNDLEPQHAVRLSEELCKHLEAEGWPPRSGFREYCVTHKIVGDAWRGYAALRAREPVSPEMGKAFITHLWETGKMLDGVTDLETVIVHGRDKAGWLRWPDILEAALSPALELDTAFVQNPETELPLLAFDVVSYVGRMNGSRVTGQDDVTVGERIMGRSLDEYTRWMSSMHAKNPRSVMYAATARNQRVCVSVAFATTPEACARICEGSLADSELTADDMVHKGRYFFVNAIVPLAKAPPVPAATRERAEVRVAFLQGAYFTRGLKPYTPFVYTFAGNPLLQERLQRHGYTPTGHALKNTDKPIMVLGSRHDTIAGVRSRGVRVSYSILKLIFRTFQAANAKNWAADSGRP